MHEITQKAETLSNMCLSVGKESYTMRHQWRWLRCVRRPARCCGIYFFFRDDAMMRNPASATEKVKKRTFTCKCDESRPARVPCHTSATQPSSRPGTPQELPRDRQSACQAGSESQISSVGFLPVLNFLSTTPRLCAISRHQLASPCTLFCVGDM